MSEEVIYKFYDLESLTQEKLNELARERNTLAEENKQLMEVLEINHQIIDMYVERINNVNKYIDDLLEENINHAYDRLAMYELCNECYKNFNKFKQETKKLEEKYEKLEKLYMFGKYLPKDDEKVDE